ncbi:MAG TPA: CBS domain-containing protein [Methanomassiliicoccales archaeon]|nr:CBS domain-containing protein [Methanomassiliicoccales archaeon]
MATVGDVMTSNPIVAQVPGSRQEVLKIMVQHNLTGLPVVRRSDGSLTGMITRQDIFDRPEEEQAAMIMQREHPTISPKASVEEAAKILVEGTMRHLPVVEGNRLVGILTPADLLCIVEKRNIDLPVEKVIRSTCVPIFQESTLAVANVILKVSKSSALPVLDEHGRLTGIVTDRDIFNKAYVDGAEAANSMGFGDDEDHWSWEGLQNVMKLWYEVSKIELPGLPIKDIMVRDPITVFKKTAISEAARIMRKNDFGQLPVRDNKDRLLAMIYDHDIISVLTKE